MKITYKNTALGLIDDPKNFAMHTPVEYVKPLTEAQDLKLLYGIQKMFMDADFAKNFTNIQYVTQPFYEAYWKSRNKLKGVVLNTAMDDSGTLIIQWPTHTQTMFYKIKTPGDGTTDNMEAFLLLFTKHSKSDSFGLDVAVFLHPEDDLMEHVWQGFAEQGRDLAWWIAEIMLFKTFLLYADVETKVVNSKRREHHLGIKYTNDSNHKVSILDSTYFTTISRTEGFGVKGHFRLQPYGPGRTRRRLQWIPDFEKKGYTRTAKVLTQNQNDESKNI